MPPTTAASSFSTIGILGQATVNNVGGDFNIAGDYNAHGTDAAKEQEVCRWLTAPDISRNYNAARETHRAQTGSWFICGEAFLKWKELPDNPLWVYGSRKSQDGL
ncbi:hypothetical protein FIBSPDRAFT_432456 [Athelia psychrophila]|uniref:Uncharacterized protein n=1 Tax=Athelia psychrophila TaxID=1759441 RepID=A0A167UJA5_9AGAM|nr:hypothetical protein FIBSPDRAFT_432456 [Fibularhizoctonia sp. CBS 109695]